MTRLEFNKVSDPYFTLDGEGVVFSAYGPMRLPDTVNLDILDKFSDNYEKKYKENLILRYPLDGSGINLEPVPYFLHDSGSENPVLTEDGSLWFEGREGLQGFIHYYRKLPGGTLHEISYEELGIVHNGRFLYKFTASPHCHKLAILNWNQNTGEKFIRILNVKTKEYLDVSMPASAENLYLK